MNYFWCDENSDLFKQSERFLLISSLIYLMVIWSKWRRNPTESLWDSIEQCVRKFANDPLSSGSLFDSLEWKYPFQWFVFFFFKYIFLSNFFNDEFFQLKVLKFDVFAFHRSFSQTPNNLLNAFLSEEIELIAVLVASTEFCTFLSQ